MCKINCRMIKCDNIKDSENNWSKKYKHLFYYVFFLVFPMKLLHYCHFVVEKWSTDLYCEVQSSQKCISSWQTEPQVSQLCRFLSPHFRPWLDLHIFPGKSSLLEREIINWFTFKNWIQFCDCSGWTDYILTMPGEAVRHRPNFVTVLPSSRRGLHRGAPE